MELPSASHDLFVVLRIVSSLQKDVALTGAGSLDLSGKNQAPPRFAWDGP